MSRRHSRGFVFGRPLGLFNQPARPVSERPCSEPMVQTLGPLGSSIIAEYPVLPRTCLPPRPAASPVPPWTPSNLAGLTRWFTGSAITGLSNGDPVPLWPDSAVMPSDAIQITTSKQPTYVASAVNSQPGVYFDGVDDLLHYSLTNVGLAHTVFLVFERLSTSSRVYVGGQGAFSFYTILLDATDWSYYAGTTGSPGTATVAHGGIPTSTWTILALRRNGTSIEFYKNEVLLGSPVLPNNVSLDVSGIGARTDGSFYADTTIAELIICNTAINNSDMALTWDYLNTLYAVY